MLPPSPVSNVAPAPDSNTTGPAGPQNADPVAHGPTAAVAGPNPVAALGECDIISPLMKLQDQGGTQYFLRMSPGGRYVAFGSPTVVNFYDTTSGDRSTADLTGAHLSLATFSSDSKTFLLLHSDAFWGLTPFQRGEQSRIAKIGQSTIAVSADGRYFAYAAYSGGKWKLRSVDGVTWETTFQTEIPSLPYIQTLSPHGRYVFLRGDLFEDQANGRAVKSGSYNIAYDLKSQRTYVVDSKQFAMHDRIVISDDGRLAIYPYNSTRLKLLNVVTGVEEPPITVEQGDGAAMEFMFDNKRIICANTAGPIRIYNCSRRERVASLVGHAASAFLLESCADGRLAASEDRSGVIYLWRLGGAPRAAPAPPPDLASLAPIPDAAAQATALATLNDAFGDDYAKAKKPADKAVLADKLFSQAGGTAMPAEKYMLLTEARDLARSGGDASLLLRIIASMGQTFAVKTTDLVTAELDAFAKMSLAPQARADLAGGLQAIADQAADAENFESANKLIAAALLHARRAEGPRPW